MKFLFTHYKERFETIFAPGIKMLSNGLALKADTYQSCQNCCHYCLGDEFREGVLRRNGIIPNLKISRNLDIKAFARFVEKAYQNKPSSTPFMDWAIRNKYFLELGTTGETFQEADLVFRTAYNFIRICSDYQIPLFINTKMNLLCRSDEYKKLIVDYKAPIIFQATFTTTDDKDGKLYEPLAPLPSERLKTLTELNKYPHIKTAVYISPFLPSVTDKDIPKYVEDIMKMGAIGAHLRDFFIQGGLTQKPIWKTFMKENKDNLEPFPGGYHVTYEAKKNFYFKVSELGKKYNPQFEIVGMKSKWFELNPYHGKMCYDYLPDSFKNGIVDFTAIPILRKIRENINKPQLLKYTKIGHKADKINLPKAIRSNEGNINNLMESGSNCNTPDVQYELGGEEWIKGVLWNGWEKDRGTGFISDMDYVFPVKNKEEFVKDEDDNYVYAYLPKESFSLIKDTNQTFLFTPNETSYFKNPYVEESDTKGFLVPEREGGTDDKFLKTT